MKGGTNDLYLTAEPGNSHFRLREFQNRDGLAMVHKSVIVSLEGVRADLCKQFKTDVSVIVTDAIRTDMDLLRLADMFGWTDKGGTVARDSKHLVRHGGIAVDLIAVQKRDGAATRVPQKDLGAVCRKHFDWVKDDYKDGHVHADNRKRAK